MHAKPKERRTRTIIFFVSFVLDLTAIAEFGSISLRLLAESIYMIYAHGLSAYPSAQRTESHQCSPFVRRPEAEQRIHTPQYRLLAAAGLAMLCLSIAYFRLDWLRLAWPGVAWLG